MHVLIMTGNSPMANGHMPSKYPIDTRKRGADGNMWIVAENDAGQRTWRRDRPPLVLVDAASVHITRYTATIACINFKRRAANAKAETEGADSKEEAADPKGDWFNNKEFMDAYDSNYMTQIRRMEQVTGVHSSNFIWCRECRGKPWRYAHFDNYKEHREIDIEEGHGWGPVVKWTNDKLIPRIPDYKMLRIDKCEADDLIGVITRWVRRNQPFRQIYILSQDSDHLQLVDDHVQILGPRSQQVPDKKYKQTFLDINREGLDGPTFLLRKIFKGDKTDGIPGCGARVTIHDIRRFIEDPDELEAFLDKKGIRAKFEKNRLLIDYAYIPKPLQNKIIKQFKALTNVK